MAQEVFIFTEILEGQMSLQIFILIINFILDIKNFFALF